MVMYHKERMESSEMRANCLALEALVKRYCRLRQEPARRIIMEWGEVLQQQFTMVNARLFGSTDLSGIAQLAKGMRACHDSMIDLCKGVQGLKMENKLLREELARRPLLVST